MDKKRLHLLLAEDNPADAELILRELRNAGFEFDYERVDTEVDFRNKLDRDIDIVLSDFAMPQFTGLQALQLVKQTNLDIPFILISGTIGEDVAVTAMRDGASDYLLKDRLTRLGQAVDHALAEKRGREQRRSAEERLHSLRRQHSLILNSAGEGIYGLDLDGRFNFVNPKAAELLGWKVDELLGKPAHETIHHTKSDGTHYPVESCPIHASLRSGATQRVTNDVLWRKDGRSFRVDYVAAPTRDENAAITGTIVTFKDITEQFATEQRLKLQEHQYRLLFQTNPNPMWVFDVKTLEILAVNDAGVAQYGYSRDEFLKLTLRDLRPSEDSVDLAKAILTPGDPGHFSGESRHRRKDDSVILVEIYSNPVIWDGKTSRMVTAIDITKRKESEERLREQADIINRAHDVVVIRNFADDKITFWNSGAERVYGWSAAEAVGRPMGELIFAETNDRETMIDDLVSTGEFHGEIEHQTKDGREVIVDSRVTLIRNDDGTPRAVVGISTDVTDKKKLETQLLRSQRLESIGTLASGVAHDLNNILTPILMCAETLRTNFDPADSQTAISLIEESARRGASVVKQVLTFARGIEGERVTINPRHLIDEMTDIARKTFPKSLEISGRYPEEIWPLKGDPTQLHQVLLNLSVNARDAMPNGGSLVIAAENFNVDEQYASMTPDAKIGPYVMFWVSDNGAGMPRATIEKIFDPFFTTKEIGKGTGLGLSSALGIVKSHGGFISVYSEIGRGSTFKVFLPAELTEEASRRAKAPSKLWEGQGELVLVVDDEPNILSVTKMILQKHNYRTLDAHDGTEAVALMAQQKHEIKVVLTDISMPYMDGVALVRAIKKMEPDTRFIASTGQGEEPRIAELQNLGVSNILTKPYDTGKLLQRLRDALEGKT